MTAPYRAAITGLGAYLPEKILTNAEIEKMKPLEESDIMEVIGREAKKLRERGTDVLEIAVVLLERFAREEGKSFRRLSGPVRGALPAVLEQVRLISNLETERDKLIQIVLSGVSNRLMLSCG